MMDFPTSWLEKSDQELVRLAKDNPEYFGVIMARYHDALARYVRRISYFYAEDIEDIIQEVFIKVYRNLNAYDESLKFSSWLYRIAHNHIIDQFRKTSARVSNVSLDDNELINFIRSAADIGKEIENRDCLEKIKVLIQGLPIKYREVLVLRFLEEKDYEEIMDILRKPKGTVATLINRGKTLLKKRMKEENINCF